MERLSVTLYWIVYTLDLTDLSLQNQRGGRQDSIEARPLRDGEAHCVEYEETPDGFSLQFTVKHEGPMTQADAVQYTVAACRQKFGDEFSVLDDVEVEIQDT